MADDGTAARRFERWFAVYPCVVQLWDISDAGPGPEHPSFTLHRITSTDDPLFARLDDPEALRGTLAYGHELVAVFDGDEFVGRGTLSFHTHRVSPYPSRPGVKLTLGPDEAWLSDGFTPPEHRRRGVGRFRQSHTAAMLRAEGIRRLYHAVEDWNEASLAMSDGLGFQPVQHLRYARILSRVGFAIPGSISPRSGPMSL